MATPFRNPDYPADVKLEYGVPQSVAFKYLDGKSVESRFPGGRCMFSLTDGRKLFLDDEDSTNLRHELTRLGVQPGECVTLTKIKHARGAGHGIRVEMEQAASGLEQQLQRSIAMAQRGESFRKVEAAGAMQTAPAVEHHQSQRNSGLSESSPAAAAGGAGLNRLLTGALIASVDAYLVAIEYAKSKGLTVSFQLDFNGEDVRQSATSLMIEAFKREGGR